MSLTNIFNDVIKNNKNFNYGLNQKRFNGKVSTAAVNMGSTKGRGSTTRMFNYCTQHSEEPSECINAFISIAAVTPPPDILFNTSSFNNFNIPSYYKTGLLAAVNRWNKFLQFEPSTVQLIKNYNEYKNWNGIEMIGFELTTNPDYIAQTQLIYIGYTSFVVKFILRINTTQISEFSTPDVICDVLTHELGHVLGFSSYVIRENNVSSGQEIMPNIRTSTTYIDSPLVLLSEYCPNTVDAYNYYEINREWQQTGIETGNYNKIIKAPTMVVETTGSPGSTNLHLSGFPYYSVETITTGGTTRSRYLKAGIMNEIMTTGWSTSSGSSRKYISAISLGYLYDLHSKLDGTTNYYNYKRKLSKYSSEITKTEFTSAHIVEFYGN